MERRVGIPIARVRVKSGSRTHSSHPPKQRDIELRCGSRGRMLRFIRAPHFRSCTISALFSTVSCLLDGAPANKRGKPRKYLRNKGRQLWPKSWTPFGFVKESNIRIHEIGNRHFAGLDKRRRLVCRKKTVVFVSFCAQTV